MPSRNKIATRLIAVIALGTTLVVALMLAVVQWHARQIIEQDATTDAQNLTKSVSDQIASILGDTSWVVDKAAIRLEEDELDDKALRNLLRDMLLNNPQIYGSTAAFEPGTTGRTPGRYAPYAYRKGKAIHFRQLEESYDYLQQDWYRIPRMLGHPLWSEPYFDQGGGDSLMTTFSVPFDGAKGPARRPAGIVTADIELDWLAKTLSSFKILDSGYIFVLSNEGRIMFHPIGGYVMHETAASIAEKTGDARLREISQLMVQGKTGFVPYTNPQGVKARLFYGPVPATGWSLGIVFPEHELFSGVARLTTVAATIGLLGILLIALITMVVARTITQPLQDLALAAARISNGDFSVLPPAARAKDEVGDLSRALIKMQQDLRQHIQDLLGATSARERIESELAIARNIQMALLPKIPAPFPGKGVIDLCAVIQPAREVGGDFYDYFWLDEQRLCLAIADVSGKGVPAAIFMAVSRTLLKSLATAQADAAQVLSMLNAQLAADNAQSMFVTLFYAVVDLATGSLTYVNAGHNPPILMPREGAPRLLGGQRQLVIGATDDYTYRDDTIQLEPGDRLLLYTDGVTEAVNGAGQFHGEQRLLATLERLRMLSAAEIVAGIADEVKAFAGDAPQADDITAMAVHWLAR